MEFLTTKQKKVKARRLLVAYGLLSILIVLATYVLISTALGFDIFKGKDVVQNGLLFVDSRPDNADVYLNDRLEADASNAKYSVPESSYDVRLVKNGYRDWSGTVQVIGGTVKFLTYPRLMPTVPASLSQQTHTSLPAFMQSRDKQWLASSTKEVPNQLTVYSLANPDELARVLTLPMTITNNKQVVSTEILEWAGDNEHFLIKVRLSETADPRYILMHRDKPAEIIDISALFPIGADDTLGLWNGKKDLIYVRRQTGGVFLGNTKDKSLSAQSLLGDTVIDFIPVSDEKALYTTKLDNQILVKLYAKDKTYVINSTDKTDKKVIMKAFGFNRNDYILLGGEAFEKTYVYRNFEKAAQSSVQPRVAPFFTMPQQSSIADVSRSNRFVMGSDGSDVAVYDIEQREFYRYELTITRPAELGWFDDVRLYARGSDNKLSVMDFSGENVYELGVSVLGIPYANRDVSVVAFQSNANGTISTNFLDIESPTIAN
jgi:hypothetical protein